MTTPSTPPANPIRWLIAVAGTLLQLCLGSVYAWSCFKNPLKDTYHWTNSQTTWAFSLAICSLGIAAAWGGVVLPRVGPRRLATVGGVLFGTGYLLAAWALARESLPWFYVGYGLVGGVGLGLGYVTPVATVARWFPDKKGLATGMVIMGFGLGAMMMSTLFAPQLLKAFDGDLVKVFAWLGVGFIVATVPMALLLRNPPAVPEQTAAVAVPAGAASALASPAFLVMWAVFFCNILAGIAIISFQSPIFQDLWHGRDPSLDGKVLAAYGGWLVGVGSLFNGLGRMFWGGLSDRIGRVAAFRAMLATQVAAFLLLASIRDPWLAGAVICYILLCYGGGFGTMPSFVLDVFGRRRMAVVYGTILTAWSAAGVAGPQLVAALNDRYPADKFPGLASTYAFYASAAVLAVGLALSLTLSGKPLGMEKEVT